MKPLYRNILLAIGLLALALTAYMVEIPQNLNWNLAAIYLPAVIGVYGLVYCLNALAYQIITNTVCEEKRISFFKSFKLTMAAFALTFITPFGFGGAPYRVIELQKYVGTPRAVSCMTLYSLMHILGHFMQWFTCVVVFIVIYPEKMNPFFWAVLSLFVAAFVGVMVMFNWFYTNGLIERIFKLLFYVPGLGNWSRRFHAKHADAFQRADESVMYLKQQKKAFWGAILCEYGSRLLNAWEFWFILSAFGMSNPCYFDLLLIVGFASFVGNVLYILPLQLGAREGGLATILSILYGAATNVGIYVSFYTRVRELFWVAVGIIFVKFGTDNLMHDVPAKRVA